MEQVSNLMFWISNGFLVPVIVGLLFFFFKSILMLGSFFNQYIQRTRQEKALNEKLDLLDKQNLSGFEAGLDNVADTVFTRTVKKMFLQPDNQPYINRLLALYEINAEKEFGQAKILIKFGPILGLMGTLIPMGPALAGLSTGDISTMAYNMQIAFATTVLGLFTGAVGFILLQVRQRWAHTDLAQLDYISELMEGTETEERQ